MIKQKPIYLKVTSRDERRQVQQHLFKIGYAWINAGQVVQTSGWYMKLDPNTRLISMAEYKDAKKGWQQWDELNIAQLFGHYDEDEYEYDTPRDNRNVIKQLFEQFIQNVDNRIADRERWIDNREAQKRELQDLRRMILHRKNNGELGYTDLTLAINQCNNFR